MKLLEKLKLDRWYGIVLYLGGLSVASSLFTKVDFTKAKHLFGFGIGLILIGIGHIVAEKYVHIPMENGMLSTKVLKHNFATKALIIIGLALTGLFGFKIIEQLI